VQVTVRHGRRTRAGIVFHRTRDFEPPAVHHGIPVTVPSRTRLALAATSSTRALERTLERADRHGLLDLAELSRLCETRGRSGTVQLSSLLAHHRSIPQTRSELERRFLRLCRGAGLPPPAVNVLIEGMEVDFVWPSRRLVVELDGYSFHRDRASFERDRRRDAKLQLAGYRVVRITYRHLCGRPETVVAELRELLGLP
jgi:very-short-patch-repair endonuclease